MVFESLLIDTFNRVLGDYIENLDKTQLQLAIWSGRVTLRNLKLLSNALDDLNMPVRLIYGIIGKFELIIPWKHIYSRPVVIAIQDVFILIAPKKLQEYNAEEELRNELEAKYEALQKIEEASLKDVDKDKSKSDSSFFEKLIAQIINNLQIKIAKVHIRYEDTTTIDKPFSCGLTLQELAIFTTDENWVKSYLSERLSQIYKVANLNSLSFYHNWYDDLYEYLSEEELIYALKNNIAHKQTLPPHYYYIIRPISTVAKVRLNMNPENDDPPFEIPQTYLSMNMELLQLGLSVLQYRDMLMIAEAVNRIYLGMPYRKYRPFKTPYATNERIWWKFAITAVLDGIKEKYLYWSWAHIREHRRLCKLYAQKLKERELQSSFSETNEQACKLLEQKLDVFNIILIRNRVRFELNKIKKSPDKLGWFRKLLMRLRRKKPTSWEFVQKLNEEITPEEKEKLYKAIGYQENAVPLNIPEHYKARTLFFTLVALEIGLYDDTKKRFRKMLSISERPIWTVVLLNFTSFVCSLEQRPSANAFSFKAAIKVMKLTGLDKAQSPPITIIESIVKGETNLIDVLYETRPLSGTCDQRFIVHAHSLQILYDSATIKQLSRFFTPPEDLAVPELDIAASHAKFKDRSAAVMQRFLETHEVFEIDINCKPNTIIIPRDGVYQPEDSSAIIISLGILRVTSKPHEMQEREMSLLFSSTKAREKLLRDVVEEVYDKYKLTIDGVQILVVTAHERWEHVIRFGTLSEMHLLRPTSISAIVAVCVFDDDPRLPKTKINIILPHLYINLTELRILETFKVLSSTVLNEGPERRTTTYSVSYGSPLRKTIKKDIELIKSDQAGPRRPTYNEKSLQDELEQYTDYELKFALKEFIVTLYADPSDDDTSSKLSSDNSEISIFSRDLPHDLVSDTSQISSVSEIQPIRLKRKIITLKLLQLEAEIIQCTYEFVITTRVGSVTITQHDLHNASEMISIVSTPRFSRKLKFQKYLLTVSVTMTDKKYPGFALRHNLTEQLIVVNFSTLTIIWHKEFFESLMTKLYSIHSQINDLIDPAITKLTKIIGEEAEEVAMLITRPHLKHTKSSSRHEVIETHFVANLEQVSMELMCKKRSIALMDVQQFNTELIIKSSNTIVNLILRNVIITDPNPLSIHSSILSIVCNNALKYQMITYNSNKKLNSLTEDIEIELEIGCIKMVFLYWFCNSIMSFFNDFGATEQDISAASAPADYAAKSKYLNEAMRIKFSIIVKAPVIVFPVHSQSSDVVVLNLGSINISNKITHKPVPKDERSPAFIDEILLEWKDVNLYRCTLAPTSSGQHSYIDTIRLSENMSCSINILEPLSFTMEVKRNLNFAWYHNDPEMDLSGTLKLVKINLLMEDYKLILSILNHNLNEGLNEFPQVKISRKSRNTRETIFYALEKLYEEDSRGESKAKLKEKTNKIKIYEQRRLNFQFDGVIIILTLDNNEELACFSLYSLSIKSKTYTDDSYKFTLFLCNIQVDERRNDRKSKIKKYLCRKDWRHKELPTTESAISTTVTCQSEYKYIMDFTLIFRNNETFAKLQFCGFDLILCIDFLKPLINFFNLPDTTYDKQESNDLKVNVPLPTVKSHAIPENSAPKLNVSLYTEELNIILTESFETTDPIVIIIEAQALLDYRAANETQQLMGQIDSIQMYMCSFLSKRCDETKHFIIQPCMISLQSTSKDDSHVQLSVRLTDLIINVSPATMELINKVLLTLQIRGKKSTSVAKEMEDYSELWKSKKFNQTEYWFINAFIKEHHLESIADSYELQEDNVEIVKTEICNVRAESITITIEDGVGFYTTPLLCIHSKINAIIKDWSSEMKIEGSLLLDMNYYNQELAAWEPLVELNERTNSHGLKEFIPWELYFDIKMEKDKRSPHNTTMKGQITKIRIYSEKILQLTLSKTGLELLNLFWEDFSQAIESKGLVKPDIISPCVVKNNTDMKFYINFTHGVFMLHDCHISKTTPTTTTKKRTKNRLKLIYLILKGTMNNRLRLRKVLPDEQVYLQIKHSRGTNEKDKNYKLYLTVADDENVKEIIVPVYKSDKRYFPIHRDPNSWAIITGVHTKFGTAKVRIHGIVIIQNHLSAKISIFQEKLNRSEIVLLGDVAPEKIYNLPLYAIYAERKALYFSLGGYKMSELGFVWNESLTEISYAREIQCNPIASFEPFFIHVVREKTQVFFENTNKYRPSSAFYTLHLRPPLSLRNALPIELTVSVAGCSVYKNTERRQVEENMAKYIVQKDVEDFGEKHISPGDVLQITSYKTEGSCQQGKSLLVLRLIQYLDKDWSCTTGISIDNAIWTFTSYDSIERMDLDLYVHFDQSQVSLLISIFSPFWMVNKTGLMLSYKTDSDTVDELYHPAEYDGAVLFSFRQNRFFDKKSTSIRVDDGEWSSEIPLDVAGSTGSVSCKANSITYVIGVHNHLTYDALTKNITFLPFFIATNKCDFLIEYQEYSRPADKWIKIEPHSCQAIWPKNSLDRKIMLKVQKQYTVPFDYSEEQCTLLKLKNNKYGGINVYVHATEGGVSIDFSQYNPGDAPGLLINHTSMTVHFYEKGSLVKHSLKPGEKIFYTWNDPTGDKLLVFGENTMTCDLRRDGFGALILRYDLEVFWNSFLDGLQRILLFTEFETVVHKSASGFTLQSYTQIIDIRIRGVGLSVVNDETGLDILYISITSSDILWESKNQNKNYFKQMSPADTKVLENLYQEYLDDISEHKELAANILLDKKWPIDFQAMTLQKNVLYYLQRNYYPGFLMSMKSTQFQMQIHCKIQNIQIDNQLRNCIFHEVLYRIPPPMSVIPNRKIDPFVEYSSVQRFVPNSTVRQYKYVSLLIQEFYFKVDFMLLNTIADFFTGTIDEELALKMFKEDLVYIEKPLSDFVEIRSILEPKNFYDHLHLGPLKIHVSFSMGAYDRETVTGFVSTLIHGLGVTLTDVNDAIFRFAYFEREYKFLTGRQLTSEIRAHYTELALKQMYVLVLGLDVLGNPYGLVVGLKRGVEDLFYEPYQGAIQGPGEFIDGLVLGMKSFFGHTIGGTAGAISRITGAVGKGLALLTLDQEFQKKRRYLVHRRPISFQDDMRRSGKSLMMGFYHGFTGVVKKPLYGAKKTGFDGFMKGFGKGAIGLVTIPAAGVVDCASVSLLAVKNVTTTYKEVRRLRYPRFLHKGKVLLPYSHDYAQGLILLRKIDRGKYSNDTFEHCEELGPHFDYLIATNQRVMFVQKSYLFEKWVVQWSFMWYEIDSIVPADSDLGDVILRLNNETNRMVYNLKTISIPNKQRRDNLVKILENLHKEA